DPRASAKEIALQHARILQYRKDLERQILESVILLSEYPLQKGAEYSASNPADSDVADFKRHVRLFQPGDYDDLIEERNANLLCGYTLCPHPKPPPSKGGPWKLINVGKANFDIVDRRESERWCSDDCKRRALYVKLQLNETAAWERAGLPDIKIELLGEDGSIEHVSREAAPRRDDMQEAENSAALALERGDVGTASIVTSIQQLTIQEKDVDAPPSILDSDSREHDTGDFAHLMVEGYK
ncbi:hypothetical protein SODALDRAFT_241351, partial [Sodiomyces alkalinus F11]